MLYSPSTNPLSVSNPTFDSGLDRNFDCVMIPTASCWACKRVGKKSPFLMYSELSTLKSKRPNQTYFNSKDQNTVSNRFSFNIPNNCAFKDHFETLLWRQLTNVRLIISLFKVFSKFCTFSLLMFQKIFKSSFQTDIIPRQLFT